MQATRIIGILITVLAVADVAAAQAPNITNARVETRAVRGALDADVKAAIAAASAPLWIGYAVPIVAGRHHMCCDTYTDDWCCGMCPLERDRGFATQSSSRDAQPIPLETSRGLVVMLRAERGRLDRIRTFTSECQLDGGGTVVQWLGNADPAASVRMLTEYARAGAKSDDADDRPPAKGAVAAIAFHGHADADRVLEGLAGPGQGRAARKDAAFWLGVARGRAGFEALRRLVKREGPTEYRKNLVFPLSQSREPEAIATLIELARQDSSGEVRGQALFWLAQKAGKQAAAAITEAIEQDPDTDIKKKAVFALSQLPRSEGVPLLIQVARTNRNPVVRKQAMFWLGQSNDARAVAFFEEVLK
jgi:hypothetical protein